MEGLIATVALPPEEIVVVLLDAIVSVHISWVIVKSLLIFVDEALSGVEFLC